MQAEREAVGQHNEEALATHVSRTGRVSSNVEGGRVLVRIILDTIARVEESLHTIPFDTYIILLEATNKILSGAESTVDTAAAAHPYRSQMSLTGQNVDQPVTLHNIYRWLVHMIEEAGSTWEPHDSF